jgi:hypothetical protein
MARSSPRRPFRPSWAAPAALAFASLSVINLGGCGMANEPSETDVGITGLVREAVTNALIAGAAVTIQNKTATTGADGRYTITELTAGNAELRVTHQGHQNVTQNVNLNGAVTQNVTMNVPAIMGVVGRWTGTWTNTTFGSTGSVDFELNANTLTETYSGSLDFGGNIFGLFNNPPPQQFAGPYGPTTTTVAISFGVATLNATITNGQITGSIVGPLGGISRVDFTGTAAGSAINMTYTVTFVAGPPAVGVVTLNKVA